MNSVFFITIRRLRAPLILIILVFALSTVGLTLIPGIDAEGKPWHMTLFEAFYFVTYTATTIGFGELPNTFTNEQRFFVLLIIYSSVVGWAYLLGSFLGLAQDKGFQQAIVSTRFRRSVGRVREPFYLVCGLGETGMTVVRALDKLGYQFTAIDRDEHKVQELEIEELSGSPPLLAGDARSPETLTAAGLLKPQCKGVLALSSNRRDQSRHCGLGLPVAARLAGHRPGGFAGVRLVHGVARDVSRDQPFPRVRTALGAGHARARHAAPSRLADQHARLLSAAKPAAKNTGSAGALDRVRLRTLRQ